MGREPPFFIPSPHPRSHSYRLESVSQLPPTVPTLSCCQFVSFPANPSLLLLLRCKLSRGDRGHEVWGHGVPSPPILNVLFFQNPKEPDSSLTVARMIGFLQH